MRIHNYFVVILYAVLLVSLISCIQPINQNTYTVVYDGNGSTYNPGETFAMGTDNLTLYAMIESMAEQLLE